MGVVNSKSPLERRNTVLRRSQRKSVHGIKSKADKIIKDIKKFKETEENTVYNELKGRIETLEKELRNQGKHLQPQIRNIFTETSRKIENCYTLLDDKLKENREKVVETPEKHEEKQDVVVEEEIKEAEDLDDSKDKRQTVELKLVEIEPIEASPQAKRLSVMKIGVPVMPGSIMESMFRQSQDDGVKIEEKITAIRKQLENLEMEISQFVGKKNGKYYNKIKEQLDHYLGELKIMHTNDEDIAEQIKLCNNYVMSCITFLDEKAVGDENDEVFKSQDSIDDSLSPRSMRTTYI